MGIYVTENREAVRYDSGGSGAGGHTIYNSYGTAVAQRTGLQFGNAEVIDDALNDKTVVDIKGAEEISYEDYMELTPEERANGTTYYIYNYPSAAGAYVFQTKAAMDAAIAGGDVPDGALCVVYEDIPYVVNGEEVTYDNTDSGLEAEDVQAAIDEVQGEIEVIDDDLDTKASKSNLSAYILTGTKPSVALNNGTFFVDKDGALRVATANIATTDDVGNNNSAIKTVGEVLSTLNSDLSDFSQTLSGKVDRTQFDTTGGISQMRVYNYNGPITLYFDGSSGRHGSIDIYNDYIVVYVVQNGVTTRSEYRPTS